MASGRQWGWAYLRLLAWLWAEEWRDFEGWNRRGGRRRHRWAFRRIDDLVHVGSIATVVHFVVTAVRVCDGDEGLLAALGAGPVEDFVTARAPEGTVELADLARTDGAFALVLHGVWLPDQETGEVDRFAAVREFCN